VLPMPEPNAETCDDCNGLVGRSRHVEPHQGMRVIRLMKKMAYSCRQCGMVWERGALGWASLSQDSSAE
jgi:hypothetical protein